MTRWMNLVGLALLLTGACAGPSERFARTAERHGLESRTVAGDGFEHVVLARPGAQAGRRLHLYLEGDGTPYQRGRPAADPTPRRPVVLDLLAQDAARAVLLGRPCYHGMAAAPGCTSALWTDARYGEAVVRSLAAAARGLAAESGASEIVLIGHSGGGTLAMLLAPRLEATVAVVTIAGNLDVAAWAAQHGLPLGGSLDPATRPPLARAIRQLHLAGGRDRVVTVATTAAALAALGGPAPTVVPGFDHICCWRELWPEVLTELQATGQN